MLVPIDPLNESRPKRAVVVPAGHGGDPVPPLPADEPVRIASFTGRLTTDQKTAQAAGLARRGLKHGSNRSTLVVEDTDPDRVATSCVAGAVAADGQNCRHRQRIITQKEIHADPSDRRTLGLASANTASKCDAVSKKSFMTDARAEDRGQGMDDGSRGCALVAATSDGVHVTPSLIDNVVDNDPLHPDEVFGPVTDFATGAKDSTDHRPDPTPCGATMQSGFGRKSTASAVAATSEPKVVDFLWVRPAILSRRT